MIKIAIKFGSLFVALLLLGRHALRMLSKMRRCQNRQDPQLNPPHFGCLPMKKTISLLGHQFNRNLPALSSPALPLVRVLCGCTVNPEVDFTSDLLRKIAVLPKSFIYWQWRKEVRRLAC